MSGGIEEKGGGNTYIQIEIATKIKPNNSNNNTFNNELSHPRWKQYNNIWNLMLNQNNRMIITFYNSIVWFVVSWRNQRNVFIALLLLYTYVDTTCPLLNFSISLSTKSPPICNDSPNDLLFNFSNRFVFFLYLLIHCCGCCCYWCCYFWISQNQIIAFKCIAAKYSPCFIAT